MMTPEELAEIEANEKKATEGPWFVSDCEGRLQIWREGALLHVQRDDTGEIIGYSTPAECGPDNLIAEWDLDTWDPGEDGADDRHRANARLMASASELLAEVTRLNELLEAMRKRSNELIDWAETAEGQRDRARAEVRNVTGERDVARAERDQAEAQLRTVRELHAEYRTYDDCGHPHDEGDPEVKAIPDDLGPVCENGYIASICRACCAGNGGGQTEYCASDHDGLCWPCPTIRALDGSEPARVRCDRCGETTALPAKPGDITVCEPCTAEEMGSAAAERIEALDGSGQPAAEAPQAERPTEDQITAAIETVEAGGLDDLVELLEVVRADDTIHVTDNEAHECLDDCHGCLHDRIGVAVTRAVLDGSGQPAKTGRAERAEAAIQRAAKSLDRFLLKPGAVTPDMVWQLRNDLGLNGSGQFAKHDQVEQDGGDR